MTAVKVGVTIQSCQAPGDEAKVLEFLGFDYAAAGEHVSFNVPVNNAFISLAAAAGATRQIRLMSTITQVPLYPAAMLAKLCAALDVASGGRFALGAGVAGEGRAEFEACGVPVSERGARTTEALDVLARLLRGDPLSYRGKFNSFDNIHIQPKPLQQPFPIWVSGRQQAAMDRAARYGHGWLPYMYTPEMLADSINRIQARRETGLPDIEAGLFIWGYVHEDGDKAKQVAIDQLSHNYRQDFSKLVDKYCFAGDPDEVAARVRNFVDAGARTLIITFACPQQDQQAACELFASQVMPVLKGMS